jgi:hypothetical protein
MLSRRAFINVAGDDMHKIYKAISFEYGYNTIALEGRLIEASIF